MRYFALAENGQKYGPADIQTLQAWINQGRVDSKTILLEEASGERLATGSLGARQFPARTTAIPWPAPTDTSPSNYYRAEMGPIQSEEHIE
ncbi:MAG: hypothetical protein ABL949_03385 [Fimbriimonadaceae bacterium]